MKELSIDLETYSDVNITKCGAYKYAESDNFEILLFGVSVDGSPVKVYDLACGDTVPEEILAALSDENVTKWAFNASFERICLSNWLKRHHPEHFYGYSIPEDPASKYLDPSSWRCTMIWSAYMGLPLRAETSRSETERRQRPHPILLYPLQTDQIKWRSYPESSATRQRKMDPLQGIQPP